MFCRLPENGRTASAAAICQRQCVAEALPGVEVLRVGSEEFPTPGLQALNPKPSKRKSLPCETPTACGGVRA